MNLVDYVVWWCECYIAAWERGRGEGEIGVGRERKCTYMGSLCLCENVMGGLPPRRDVSDTLLLAWFPYAQHIILRC